MRQKTLLYVLFVVVLIAFNQNKSFSQDKVFFNPENPETFLSLECSVANDNAIILSVLLPNADSLYRLPSESGKTLGILMFTEKKVTDDHNIYLYQINQLGAFNLEIEKSELPQKRGKRLGFITGKINIDTEGNCQLEINSEVKQKKVRQVIPLDSLYNMYGQELNSNRKKILTHFIQKNEDIQYSIKVDTVGLYPTYEFELYNAHKVKLLETDLSNIDSNSLINDNKINITLPKEEEVSLILKDELTERKTRINYVYGEGLNASFSSTSFDGINFNIQGGKKPYYLSFPDNEGINHWGKYFRLRKNDGTYILDKKVLDDSPLNGNFSQVRIYDRSKKGFVSFELEDRISLNSEAEATLINDGETESSSSNMLYYLVAGLLFFIVGGLVYKFILKSGKKAVEKDIKQVGKDNTEVEKSPEKTEGENKTDPKPEVNGVAVVPRKKKRLKVKNKRKMPGEILAEDFTLITQSKGYSGPLNISELWSDSVLKQIYLFVPFIEDLHDFLERENLSTITEEKMGMVPEIGGFIMGRYATVPNVGLSLLLEEFVPFIPEYSDAFKIEIGTKTQVRELAAALEKFPNKGVMGWFHTHPGHGLFLSNPDLEVHKHFPYPFQVAMEIESLTKNLDLAFFTQKANGEMNNTYTSGKPAQWFSWRDIENKLNHH